MLSNCEGNFGLKLPRFRGFWCLYSSWYNWGESSFAWDFFLFKVKKKKRHLKTSSPLNENALIIYLAWCRWKEGSTKRLHSKTSLQHSEMQKGNNLKKKKKAWNFSTRLVLHIKSLWRPRIDLKICLQPWHAVQLLHPLQTLFSWAATLKMCEN